MCRNIKTLYNFDPPATEEEVHEAALQFVRKIAGTRTPSTANASAFKTAVNRISAETRTLLHSLTTSSSPKNREVEAAKLRRRSAKRFG